MIYEHACLSRAVSQAIPSCRYLYIEKLFFQAFYEYYMEIFTTVFQVFYE